MVCCIFVIHCLPSKALCIYESMEITLSVHGNHFVNPRKSLRQSTEITFSIHGNHFFNPRKSLKANMRGYVLQTYYTPIIRMFSGVYWKQPVSPFICVSISVYSSVYKILVILCRELLQLCFICRLLKLCTYIDHNYIDGLQDAIFKYQLLLVEE